MKRLISLSSVLILTSFLLFADSNINRRILTPGPGLIDYFEGELTITPEECVMQSDNVVIYNIQVPPHLSWDIRVEGGFGLEFAPASGTGSGQIQIRAPYPGAFRVVFTLRTPHEETGLSETIGYINFVVLE